MTREISTHLSEDALNDVLIGLGSAESEHHMAYCAECRSRVELFRADIHFFNQASLAWSEAQPSRRIHQVHAASEFRMPVALLGVFAAAILAVAVVIPVWHHEHTQIANQENTSELQGQDSQAQIAQDNQLLEAVNAALSPKEESPVVEYGLSGNRRAHGKAQSK